LKTDCALVASHAFCQHSKQIKWNRLHTKKFLSGDIL
jgi:hypothetical protein